MQYTAFHQVRFYDTTLWFSIPEDVHAVSVQPNAFNPMQYTAFHQVRFYDTTLWCSIPEDVHAVSVQPNAFNPMQYTAFRSSVLYLKMYMLFLCHQV